MRSREVDGFGLEYDYAPLDGAPVVVMLHGWPGDRRDFRLVAESISGQCAALVPDLRGFGGSDRHAVAPTDGYSGVAQAGSVIALIEELGLGPVVLAGYDIGSRIAQVIALERPDLVAALVITPPVPGAGARALSLSAVKELWYQTFNQLDLIEEIVRGEAATRAYLTHFWRHWSGPAYAVDDRELDRLAAAYARPGAFAASIAWYRAAPIAVERAAQHEPAVAPDRIRVPTTILWPELDPLMPFAWSDRVPDYFADATIHQLDGIGHFVPLEAPERFAAAIISHTGTP